MKRNSVLDTFVSPKVFLKFGNLGSGTEPSGLHSRHNFIYFRVLD